MPVRLLPHGIPIQKRIFDLLVVIPGLILVSPILVVVALAVRIFTGQPILFRQPRPGYRGEIFTVYKFRTMHEMRSSDGHSLPDAERVSRLGLFLRATSLDELPELFNILRGEMSLVGPRPLLVKYLGLYSAEQMRRHDVLPGLTGWAQINGRNILTWQEKFLLDVWYVDHWSIWLDMKILARTFLKVLRREGVSEPGQATTQEFTGNP